ncbi:uncharacterized protein LOC111364535 [Spodoptera litura]|uniref:Uncharacterized protein LOC111351638 n=1 Tax=Spodoptera litura TaxID=69820 RepID=A0A9J7J3T7_SPOLT|nr:uncharacterized protein LOC111351638 [Spodoptera litura]XP_022835783.1 uncharacterized protein LOC111363211 [Spodoptera litura]XP_022837208.1 uncharacterized protein LOC111364535 [Spodoptera litura]
MEKEFQDAHGPTMPLSTQRSSTSDVGESIKNIDIFKVGTRLPPFWPEEPEVWFGQVEGQFAISGITSDSTKFHYVISQLDTQYAREVKDLIISPPASNKYDKLKVELIKRLTASKEKKLKQLLMHEELGDRKPSQFLRHLKSLAGVNVPDDFLKTIWISRLSHGIQTVLAGQPPTATIDDLSDLADRIQELAAPSPSVAFTSAASPNTALDVLVREVAELRRQVQQLSTGRNSRARTRSTRSPHHRSSSRSTRSESNYRKFPLCWYHGKFGEKASKCVTPCDYKSGNARGGR